MELRDWIWNPEKMLRERDQVKDLAKFMGYIFHDFTYLPSPANDYTKGGCLWVVHDKNGKEIWSSHKHWNPLYNDKMCHELYLKLAEIPEFAFIMLFGDLDD